MVLFSIFNISPSSQSGGRRAAGLTPQRNASFRTHNHDWSGGSRRRKNRRNAIGIAYGGIEDDSAQTESPPSRSEVVELPRSLIYQIALGRNKWLVRLTLGNMQAGKAFAVER